MELDWAALTKLTGGAAIRVERVRLVETGVALEGQFAPPPLAQLPAEDQIFVAAFVRCHGSIKQMEKFFGVSYPTIKSRLNRIGNRLPFAEIAADDELDASDLLSRLEGGELTAGEVITRLDPAHPHAGSGKDAAGEKNSRHEKDSKGEKNPRERKD